MSAAVSATRSTNRIILRGRGLEPKVVFFAQKLCNLGPVLNKLMELKRITEGAWEGARIWQSLQPLGDFCNFTEKIEIFTPFQSHFARV